MSDFVFAGNCIIANMRHNIRHIEKLKRLQLLKWPWRSPQVVNTGANRYIVRDFLLVIFSISVSVLQNFLQNSWYGSLPVSSIQSTHIPLISAGWSTRWHARLYPMSSNPASADQGDGQLNCLHISATLSAREQLPSTVAIKANEILLSRRRHVRHGQCNTKRSKVQYMSM